MTDEPTGFPELNEVLRQLVSAAREAVSENFCGAYLQGSFAVGDADVYSDVDFMVVTHDEIGTEQTRAIAARHAQVHAGPIPWAQHLEGSYVEKAAVRRVDPTHAGWIYFDNGSTRLERSDHDNNAVTRWTLREHGVVLAGPDPKTLVDPVSAEVLRTEVLATIRDWAVDLRADPDGMDNAWRQPHVVLSYCRTLHTLAVGRVTSKPDAGRWALSHLDARWNPLIQQALDDRPDPWLRVHRRAHPGTVDATWAFIDDVLVLADAFESEAANAS
jgi:predicted nucleotidyltransferase